jgi:hypothetical protein
MFSLRSQTGRMAFLLQLCAGTLTRSDVEAVALQESESITRKRPVLAAGTGYSSITEAAGIDLICQRLDGKVNRTMNRHQHHLALQRIKRAIVREINKGSPGYRFL